MSFKLKEKGVETRPFFTGMHEQPVFKKQAFTKGAFPVAESLSRSGLYLPSGFGLGEAELDHVSAALREVLR